MYLLIYLPYTTYFVNPPVSFRYFTNTQRYSVFVLNLRSFLNITLILVYDSTLKPQRIYFYYNYLFYFSLCSSFLFQTFLFYTLGIVIFLGFLEGLSYALNGLNSFQSSCNFFFSLFGMKWFIKNYQAVKHSISDQLILYQEKIDTFLWDFTCSSPYFWTSFINSCSFLTRSKWQLANFSVDVLNTSHTGANVLRKRKYGNNLLKEKILRLQNRTYGINNVTFSNFN